MASRRRIPLWLSLVILAGACDGEPASIAIEPVPGTRLAPLYRGADGSRIFVGWFDRELQTECMLIGDGEGVSRCHPIGATVPAHTDPHCVSPLVEAACPGVRFRTDIAFGQPAQSFSLMPQGPVPPLFLEQQDMCLAASNVPLARLPANASLVASTPIANETLVQMHEEIVPLNEELEVMVLAGSDGSRSPHAWRDRKRGSRCMPAWTEHGLRCLPSWSSPAAPLAHIDSACTLPLFPFGGADGDIMALPDAGPPNAPPARSPFGDRLLALYRMAPIAKGVPTFVKTPAGCQPQGVTGDTELAAVERIDTRAFPKLDIPGVAWLADTMFQVGENRVVLDQRPGKLHRDAGASCYLSPLADGRMACLQADHPLFTSTTEGCGEVAYFDAFVTPRRLIAPRAGDSVCTAGATKIFALTLITEPPLDPAGRTCVTPQDPQGFQHSVFAVGPEVAPGAEDLILTEAVRVSSPSR